MQWYESVLAFSPGPGVWSPKPGRILVVEDNLSLRRGLTGALKTLSPDLRVDWASSVEQIDLYGRCGGLRLDYLYDLVISDIVLPGELSGIEFWNICQTEFPQLKFLLMSGMDEREYAQKIRSYRRSPPPFLQKPFSPTQYRERVADLIYGS